MLIVHGGKGDSRQLQVGDAKRELQIGKTREGGSDDGYQRLLAAQDKASAILSPAG
jgi:hypothetical protein